MKKETFDPIEYWENRHYKFKNNLKNVGNIGLTSEQNNELISVKAAIIVYELGLLGVSPKSSLLDAGSGAGYFTNFIAEAGFDIKGVDCSRTGVRTAIENYGEKFVCSSISEFNISEKYDVVLCLDVLYHIVDDEEWKVSLNNILGHIKGGGYLFIIECISEKGEMPPKHVTYRNLERYINYLNGFNVKLHKTKKIRYPYETKEKLLMIFIT